jgi:hypothetical protein
VRGKEILEELQSVLSAKTLDALLPPFVFVFANGFLGLDLAVALSLLFALVLGLVRLARKQTWQYALGGLLGVAAASGMAYVTRSAANYFLSAAVISGGLSLVAASSLIVGKPLAAWASHLTRGWPIDWFWRHDIKPAYREVTWLWTLFFLMRLSVQIVLLRAGDAVRLAWANLLLGWPVTLIVLVLSYVYGIWRLHSLGGPGVDEFQAGKEPPWRGQVRGF